MYIFVTGLGWCIYISVILFGYYLKMLGQCWSMTIKEFCNCLTRFFCDSQAFAYDLVWFSAVALKNFINIFWCWNMKWNVSWWGKSSWTYLRSATLCTNKQTFDSMLSMVYHCWDALVNLKSTHLGLFSVNSFRAEKANFYCRVPYICFIVLLYKKHLFKALL